MYIIYKSLVIILCQQVLTQNLSQVEHLKKLIQDGISNSMTFELPTDAREFEAPVHPIKDFGAHDFVIIGGGTAGSVLASRLTENKHFNVLVLEAGNFSNDGFEQFVNYFPFQANSPLNWGYKSVPQKYACHAFENNSCFVSQGKGVGGSTLINAALYSRGHPKNYDDWAKITRDPSWRYQRILKYFLKAEDFHWTDTAAVVDMKYHGRGGLLHVEHNLPDFYITQSFMEACSEFGYNQTDYNSPRVVGTSIHQKYTKRTKRNDFGTAFVKPFLNRPNLKVLTNAFVTKIEIDKKTKQANSVLFTHNGFTYRTTAKKEVLLSAGSVKSPQILMLSGIGPKEHLNRLGIDLIQNLEVGSALRDHCYVLLRVPTNITVPQESLDEQVRNYMDNKGSKSDTHGIAFLNLNQPKGSVPNLELFKYVARPTDEEMKLMRYKEDVYRTLWANNGTHFQFYLINLDVKSTGTVRLRDNSPYSYPLVDLGFLSDEKNEDREFMYESIQFLLKLIETEPYKKLGVGEIPGPLKPCEHLRFKSKEYWYCYIRYATDEFYHPMGTCPMGVAGEPGAVVNSKLEVFGVGKLRVVDSSVMPKRISGHTSASVGMIAEKISDVIKSKYFFCRFLNKSKN
ncbi:unnamed protein product [Phyllotreta striolata]|uniref:Glucose-methanol-choline oxidoreductase N-terminal domain-containing protein n=1 Tax=Phyllotreta striolata TaxID=444603 RepID=A0A9N9TQ93_PHYSR|nr:unnamed protein product [Phyllotreta striolata]